MLCPTDAPRVSRLAVLFAALLVPAAAASAQAAYLDASSLVGGAVVSAFHPRAGVVFPLGGRLSFGAEGDAYRAAGNGERFLQADILCLARYRPLAGNAYLGAGLGLGASVLTDAEGGTGGYPDPVIVALLVAEAGIPIRPAAGRFYLEPFLRGYVVGWKEARGGGEAGIRLGWSFRDQGENAE